MTSESFQRQIIFFCMGVVLIFAFIAGMQPIWEFDIWWHLKAGEWIVQHLQFPTMDIFSSIHPEREWKTFNWLFEVIIYRIQFIFGLLGLRIFAAILLVSGLSLWLTYFIRQTKDRLVAMTLLIFLLMIYIDRVQIRPHLTNLVFEALILLFYHSGGLLKTWSKRIIFFTMALLWTNLHTPCSAVGMCAVWFGSFYQVALASHVGRSQKEVFQEMLWPVIIYAVAICCNPYGPQLLWSGVNNIAPVFGILGEWKPPLMLLTMVKSPHEVLYAVTPILTFIFALIFLFRYRHNLTEEGNKMWLISGGVPIAFLLVSQISLRFVYLSIPRIAWLLSFQKLNSKKAKYALSVASLFFAQVLYAYQINGLGGARATLQNLKRNISSDPHPDVANLLINEANLSGTAYSAARWGGYLLWFSPSLTGVFADTRNNMSIDAFEIQNQIDMNIRVDSQKIASYLDQTHNDFAVLERGSFPFSHWPIDRWIRVAHDEQFEVFMRTNSSNLSKLREFFRVGQKSTPLLIEQSATRLFGERYYVSKLPRIAELQNEKTEDAVHRLGLIEKIAGHDRKALEIFEEHLSKYPTCLFAILEIGDILDAQGRYADAIKFLSPIQELEKPPIPLQILWDHLQTHIRN